MRRYRQQLKRDRARRAPEIAAEIAAGPPRPIHVGERIPADAVPGEVFEVWTDVDGTEVPLARVRLDDGLFGRKLTVIA